jgi:hypothetical protein
MNAPFPILAVDARTRAHLDARSWEPRTWWQTRTATLFFVLIACLPLLYPAIPPLVDLPGHMGRYRVELDLAHSPELQRHFTYT